MKITFTKCIYQDYEVDVPFEEYQNKFNDSKEEAVLEYMQDAIKVREEVELDDIELGELDDEDEEFQKEQFKQWELEATLEEYEYLGGVL